MEMKENLKVKGLNLPIKPDWTRSIKELKNVLYDSDLAKAANDFDVYYVWRKLDPKKNFSRKFFVDNMSYDITIIQPKMLGKEFPKTKGHKHNCPELIKVLEGEAIYLSQWGKNDKIDKIEATRAKKGDWIIYSPNADHLTVNPGKKRLVMANNCLPEKSDYSLFERYQGAGYYYLKSGWVKNKNYKKVPKLRFKKPDKKPPQNLNFLYA